MKLTLTQEIDRFEASLKDYLDLKIDAERFTSIRLQQGVYGQRQEGVNMLRVKIPGGSLDADQLEAIADALDTHSRIDTAHVTTRQDIQIHSVPLGETPDAMRILEKANLTTREACGNTVRNITACPMAGVCPKEHVDVLTHVEGAALHFLRNPLSQQLPRKFKISFSGCESDCAQSMIHDLGIIAVHREGRFGFSIRAGGGLGHKPREAILIEEFAEESDLLIVMEALVSLHNRYSDRTKRAKSRIKFLVERFGPQGFIEKYREELAVTKSALSKQPYPEGSWKRGADVNPCGQGAPRGITEQKQEGLFVLPIALPLGQLTSLQLRGLSAIARRHALQSWRTTQDQNLMIMNVQEHLIPVLSAELSALGLGLPARGDSVTACPGTSTCRLGITSSMVAAQKLGGGHSDLRIRVSGCHNGCAQPETGDIGIYGEGRRLHGRLVPHYQIYLGGDGTGEGALAIKGPSVPAARIEEAVFRLKEAHAGQGTFFSWVRSRGREFFDELLGDLVEVGEAELPFVLQDHGELGAFKVMQLGGGECAGASQVRIGSSFFEAAHERRYRDALFMQRKYGEAARCSEAILVLIGSGLVQLLGGDSPQTLSDISSQLNALMPGDVSARFEDIAKMLSGSESESLSNLFRMLDAWTADAAEYCALHDSQLDLSEALPRAA